MEKFEVAIIGGGAAGLSAALYLGISLKKVVVFDNSTNRNRVTQKSHGFLTRDGITPSELRDKARQDVDAYENVRMVSETVIELKQTMAHQFLIETTAGGRCLAERVVLATGIQERFSMKLPIKQYYGRSLFSCPYCDAYPLRDKALVVIAENEGTIRHLGELVSNWTNDLIIATNGQPVSNETNDLFERHGIEIETTPIASLIGKEGMLEAITFTTGRSIERQGGFVVPDYERSVTFAEELGCDFDNNQQIITDDQGRTTIPHLYVAGEYRTLKSSSLMLAAADGNLVATAVNMDSISAKYQKSL